MENCSLKSTHNTRRYKNCSLKSTHNTRRYKNCSLKTRTIPGDKNCSLKHMHNTRWNKTVLGETHTIPGGVNISFERSSGEGGILGAWCYTRQVGQRRSLRRAVQVQGIPGGVARGSVPGKAATSQSTPVGSRRRWCDLKSFVYTRVAWWTAITKSNLAFVYNRSLPDSVYTRSFPRFCLYQVIARFCL